MNEDKRFKLAEGGSDQKVSAFEVGVKVQREAVGSSGTEVFAGYFSEEYLNTLQGGPRVAGLWDKMRRSESQVAMLIGAISNPIKSGSWELDAYDNSPEALQDKEFIEMALFEGIDFETFKHEALTMIFFGFSLFELVHNIVFDHPKFGTFNGLQSLGFRSQKTIQAWNLEKKTGRILSVQQWAQGDIGNNVIIPGDFILVITNNKEGDNYEGISALRPMYGAFIRKQLYLKLTAIGVEKYAVGVPIGTIPSGKENSPDAAKFKEILAAYTSHEKSYITKPEGWTIELQKNDFDASKIVTLLQYENTEMINSVVANFLALGTMGNGGAFALSNDLSDFFTSGIQTFADTICAAINRKVIPDLIKLNFGQRAGYPKLKVTGISDKAGKELADILKSLIDAQAIKPDDNLEDYLRKQYKVPQSDPATARQVSAPSGFGGASAKSTVVAPTVDKLTLAETKNDDKIFVADLDSDKTELKKLMQTELRGIALALKKSLNNAYSSASGDNKLQAGTKIVTPDLTEYKAKLQEMLAKVAARNYAQAGIEVRGSSKKLVEFVHTIKLAVPQGTGYYAALPDKIKKIVQAQAILIAETQEADLEKVIAFQFTSSATGTDDISKIDSDIDAATDKVIDGSTSSGMSIDAAAGNAVSHVANQARTEHFFESDVLDDIDSFTFENNDPVSEICQELAGTTFDKNDPKVDEYTPPLHHNCKSRMTVNLKGVPNNPPVDDDVTISDSAKKSMTLAE